MRPRILQEFQGSRSNHDSVRSSGRTGPGIGNSRRSRSNLFRPNSKSLNDGSQAITNKTLDLQSIQDDVAQMQEASTRIGAEIEALPTSELGRHAFVQSRRRHRVPRSRDQKIRFMMIGYDCMLARSSAASWSRFPPSCRARRWRSVDQSADGSRHFSHRFPTLPPAEDQEESQSGHRVPEKGRRYWHNLLINSIDATRTLLLAMQALFEFTSCRDDNECRQRRGKNIPGNVFGNQLCTTKTG